MRFKNFIYKNINFINFIFLVKFQFADNHNIYETLRVNYKKI